jgi:hypothetical protein
MDKGGVTNPAFADAEGGDVKIGDDKLTATKRFTKGSVKAKRITFAWHGVDVYTKPGMQGIFRRKKVESKHILKNG